MRDRIQQELQLLKPYYRELEHAESPGEDWFLLPRYPFPSGWQRQGIIIANAPVAFKINASYPVGEPYGFLIPTDATFNGLAPHNSAQTRPLPFEGNWQQLSWAPIGWRAGNDAKVGSNLLIWTRSFATRLKEGV